MVIAFMMEAGDIQTALVSEACPNVSLGESSRGRVFR